MSNSKLFEKITLNNGVEVDNRLAVPPLTLFASNQDGSITDEERNYLKVRGKDIGLYILGATIISKEGMSTLNFPIAMSEKDIPSLEERAKIIKSNGSKAICQINHAGCLALKEMTGLDPVVPSAEVAIKDAEQRGSKMKDFHELNDEEIKKLIEKFAYTTELLIKSGYDGVEIHGANNYLIQQFYSPHTNKRTDDWGGSDEKRMKFALEIVDAICKVREKCKCPKFIIGYRLSPEEPYEDGITMTETLKLIRCLVKKPLQFIHISQKDYFKKTRRGEGAGIERLKVIHEITKDKVALVGVGGLRSEKQIMSAINSGFSEFVAVGNGSMMNKDLGTLLKEGKGDKLEVELDTEHPEKYALPNSIWQMCFQKIFWLPPIKGNH